MASHEYPRLIGPIQRGTTDWHILYAARSRSERTNSDAQEGIDNGRPSKLRGLKAFRFAGAIRTVAHVLRRAMTFILDVTYIMGTLQFFNCLTSMLSPRGSNPGSIEIVVSWAMARILLLIGAFTRTSVYQ